MWQEVIYKQISKAIIRSAGQGVRISLVKSGATTDTFPEQAVRHIPWISSSVIKLTINFIFTYTRQQLLVKSWQVLGFPRQLRTFSTYGISFSSTFLTLPTCSLRLYLIMQLNFIIQPTIRNIFVRSQYEKSVEFQSDEDVNSWTGFQGTIRHLEQVRHVNSTAINKPQLRQ